MTSANAAFARLVTIMNELREQCPWDRKQTIHTLRSMTIEEMYELMDAIDKSDWVGIKEELGDLLLHLLFYSKIGAEENQFQLEEMINGICEKLIIRHPHIYGDVKVADEGAVERNWQKIKAAAGKPGKSALEGVPVSLPAMVKALRIQDKAKHVGFEWDNKEDVWKKVEEEIGELQEAILLQNKAEIEAEFGDILFSLVNYARFLQVDPEAALEKTNRKFISRFKAMETISLKNGNQLSDLSLEQMDAIWNMVKKQNSID